MTGKKKAICFFIIFLLVNAFGLSENEKTQNEKNWKSENYVAQENENNRNLKRDNGNNEKESELKKNKYSFRVIRKKFWMKKRCR